MRSGICASHGSSLSTSAPGFLRKGASKGPFHFRGPVQMAAEGKKKSMMPSLNLKKFAMGIVPYGNSAKKEEDPHREGSDSEWSSHSTFSVASSSSSLGRSGSAASAASAHSPSSPLASPHRGATGKGGAARAERKSDEESILNGWVRRYFALQQQVPHPPTAPAHLMQCIPARS